MRTVEQIEKELNAARREADAANKRVKDLESEARDIYQAVSNLLNIKPNTTMFRSSLRDGTE